jgi:polysaccharide biosynthesis/export protein
MSNIGESWTMDRRSAFRVLGFGALAAALPACAPVAVESPAAAPVAFDPGEYRLGSGDTLRVTVFGEQQLSGEFRVDGSGKIAMPLIGEVSAADRTTREVEQEIAGRLSQGYVRDPKVGVEVSTHRPFFILGEVRTPGQYAYVSGMTALSAVAVAGGFTYRAQEDYVLVTRASDPSRKPRRLPVTAPILPDDVVRVPERYF